MDSHRRRFLAFAAAAPLAALTIGRARAQTATCYDPAALPLSQKNRRRSLGYVEVSADPAKRCAGCVFFTAGADGCGTCGLLNGPVSAGAVCASFAPRAK